MRLAVLLALCLPWLAESAATYNEQVAPILNEYCAPCHRPGQSGPFPLLTYDDARKRAGLIAEVTKRRYMPPWLPEAGYGEFAGERRLTEAQIRLIEQWARAGAPEGAAAQRREPVKFASDWAMGKPDLVIEAPKEFTVPADGPDVFWNFVLRQPLRQGRFVKAIEIRPGNTGVVHHANMVIDRTGSSRRRERAEGEGFPGMDLAFESDSFDPDSHFLFWKPGTAARAEPEGMAWRLDAGNDLILNVHLRPAGKPEPIRPVVGLYFADRPPVKTPMLIKLENDRALDIPPGARDFLVSEDFRLPVDVDILAVYPHAHYLGKLLEGYATLPDGSRRWLVRIPNWDVAWQAVYGYRTPLFLPKGSVVSMRYHFDNSAANPRNPNSPPRRVRAGNQATDEMGHLWLQVLPRGAGDQRPVLQEALLRHRIERYADDAGAHLGLGALLLARKESGAAIAELQAALRLTPGDAQGLNNLGAALKLEGRNSEAIAEFRRALAVQPEYPNARFNLGGALAADEKPVEAAAEFRRFLATNPEDREARAQLRGLLIESGDRAMAEGKILEAVECYRELVTMEPDNADLRNNLGILLARRGDLAGAIAEFEAALKADPAHAAARRNLERLRSRQ